MTTYESYKKMKREHQAEVDNFPLYFAFNDRQFEKAMKEAGLRPEETDKVCSIGMGGFVRKTDAEKFAQMMVNHYEEQEQSIAADETGEGFIKEMFLYELGNHEYIVTGRLDDTLDALGLTMEEVKENEALEQGLIKARNEYIRRYNN